MLVDVSDGDDVVYEPPSLASDGLISPAGLSPLSFGEKPFEMNPLLKVQGDCGAAAWPLLTLSDTGSAIYSDYDAETAVFETVGELEEEPLQLEPIMTSPLPVIDEEEQRFEI